MRLEHWGTVANRMYYACFYAINSYLALKEIPAVTHKGVKSAFHNELIKGGFMSQNAGKFYNDLFNKRQEADYKDFIRFDREMIEPLFEETKSFVTHIRKTIAEQSDKK